MHIIVPPNTVIYCSQMLKKTSHLISNDWMFKYLSNDKKNVFYKNNHHKFDRSYKVIKNFKKPQIILIGISLKLAWYISCKIIEKIKMILWSIYTRLICSPFTKSNKKPTNPIQIVHFTILTNLRRQLMRSVSLSR